MNRSKERTLADVMDDELLGLLYSVMYQRKAPTYRPRPFDVEPNRKLIASSVSATVAPPLRRR